MTSPNTTSTPGRSRLADPNPRRAASRAFRGSQQKIHQMHRDIVTEWPGDAVRLGSSPACDVQAMYSPRRYISVQGHPEFNGEIMDQLVEARHDSGLFDDELYRSGLERAGLTHDGVAIAAAFLRFMLE